MFQVVTMWNLSRPDEEMEDNVQDLKLRGYCPETFLTGQFAVKLSTNEIKPLSVSNIADKYCHTRRDLYFMKGFDHLNGKRRQITTWGQRAGHIAEDYIEAIVKEQNKRNKRTYSKLRSEEKRVYDYFNSSQNKNIEKLKALEEKTYRSTVGDTEWLLSLLSNTGRAELGLKLLHSLIKEDDSIDFNHIEIKTKIKPKPNQIGINSPATPDFIILDRRDDIKTGIVGDIKTGTEFKPFHQLTCAGYALAYENQHKKDINWGIIYFFPTRNPTAYVRPITFAQIYIFPIDDNLRRWFINFRDDAYNKISGSEPPELPPEDKRNHCYYCRFKDYCKSQGLELKNDVQE